MPRNKDLKRLVRARMKKTGEAFTAARAQLTRKSPVKAVAPADTSPSPLPIAVAPPTRVDYAARAGTSDQSIKEKTGCTWERWVFALDRQGAEQMSHRDIAALVSTKYKLDSWWSQAVTVGYERIKGMRARGQRRDGTYEATKSRTYNVSVTTLFDAWANARVRRQWLRGTDVKVRTATAPKSMRLDWADGGIIAVGFFPKGKAKSMVALSHAKLADKETADRLKKFWSERLDALAEAIAVQ